MSTARPLCNLSEEFAWVRTGGSLARVQGLDGLINTFPAGLPGLATSAGANPVAPYVLS